jgi:hypothetical protein
MIAVLTACILTCSVAAGAPPAPEAPPQQSRADRQPSSPSTLGLQGYSVVLVVGDMQTAGGGDTVPPAARKALTDMQAFLPFKRYQLLDAAWMLCCGAYRSSISGRMRGPEEREYAYSIDTLSGDEGKLTVRFAMRESASSAVAAATASAAASAAGSASSGARVGGGARGSEPSVSSDALRAEHARQFYEAQKERDEAEIQMQRGRQLYEAGTMNKTDYEATRVRYQQARNRVEELERIFQPARAAGGPRPYLLDSTFSIAVGETVVIGTSRLKGDQALIALLTAAGKPTAAR